MWWLCPAPGWASCIYFRLELCGDFGFPAPGWASCIYFRLELCGDFGFPVVDFPFTVDMLCSDIFWFQSYWGRDILHGHFILLFGNYMVVIQTLFTDLTLLCHVLKGLFTNCDTWRVSSYFEWILTGATCEAGNAHYFRNTWFHSLWKIHNCTHSLYIHYRMCRTMFTD